MTFYNIIFGFLFIAAFRETIRSLNAAIATGDLIPVWQATTLAILIFSDTIFTSVMIEGGRRKYLISLKLIDLCSFIVLSIAVFTIDPSLENSFQLDVENLQKFLVTHLNLNPESLIWLLITVYTFLLIAWNEIPPGTYELLGVYHWSRFVQPTLTVFFLLMTILALTMTKSIYVMPVMRPLACLISLAYFVLFKKSLVGMLTAAAEFQISRKRITVSDVDTIAHWPSYPPHVCKLDYALRRGGWLDSFPESKETHRMGWWQGDDLVGFSILTHLNGTDGEFYIAVHPEKLGQKLGEAMTRKTIAFGFHDLQLKRIYLKVRDWHTGAQHLYQRVGFKTIGPVMEEIQGVPVDFIAMELRAP